MSDRRLILSELKQGKRLTAKDAEKLGVFRLAARIYDLRNMGYQIESKKISVRKRGDKKALVASYKLVEPMRATA